MVLSDWFLLVLFSAALACGGLVLVGRSRRTSRRAPPPPSRVTFSQDAPALPLRTSAQSDAESENAQTAWERLTRREKQVARLAASQLTDVQIAERLCISEHTVGNHLYNLYGKLEIRSRRELKYILQQIVDDS